MSEREPTNNGDTPRPSAAPQANDPGQHRSALFSSDPVYQFHKLHHNVPEITDPEPLSGPEVTPDHEADGPDIPVETEIPETSVETRLADQSAFVRWLIEKPPVLLRAEVPAMKTDSPVEDMSESTDESSTERKVRSKKKKRKKKKKKIKAKKQKKKKSSSALSLGDDIVSEPLAEVLVSQGHYREAAAMYRRLSLIYPEKSRLFAAKIEELNKNAQ